jgi:spore coat protein CotF
MTAVRTTWQRAQAHDPEFERALVDEIGTAIAQASLITDANVMAVRTGETIAALTTIMAGVLAMTPCATRSPTAMRKIVDEIAKKLRVLATQTAADPEVRAFLERVFHHGDDVGERA